MISSSREKNVLLIGPILNAPSRNQALQTEVMARETVKGTDTCRHFLKFWSYNLCIL